MFVDEAEIFIQSGRGGDGFVHFHREKYVSRGGPDGGDGGKGGDIIFQVEKGMNTLATFRHQRRYIAKDGAKGGVCNQTGRSSEPIIIAVPQGTMVYDIETGELLGDLVDIDQMMIICKGGRGGRGNQHFASPRQQAPRTAERGEPGQEYNVRLVLKLIADVGIIGIPNAGKSSLLAAVTNAKPKIADYPFTTLVPNLGVAELDLDTSIVLADIPGLIEGAHTGLGLGDTFLRHIQRTRVLIHLLDGTSEDPIADFTQINSELALFDPMLSKKPQIVVLNKIDLPEVQENWESVKLTLEKMGYNPVVISALTHSNLDPLLWKAYELLKTAPIEEPIEQMPVYRPMEDKRSYTISTTNDGWRVSGAAIERAADMTLWEYEGSVRRFQRILKGMGIEDALREAGIKEGDMVSIGDYELEWQD